MGMKGYKGFNEKFQCTPGGKVFQYEVGKEYEHEGDVDWCKKGFHFVENPLLVFHFYPPTGRFAEVDGDGVSDKTDETTKRVAKRLHIKAELSLSALIGLGVKFILDKVDFTNAPATNTGYQSAATNTGDQSAATNTGTRSAATNTGDQSAATNTGDQSAATNTGEEGCAVSLGIEGKAKGAVGCWLTIAEWKQDKEYNWHRIDVQTKKVDGKKIKADTFYVLKDGKFVEVKA
jgi:hypothetical protein